MNFQDYLRSLVLRKDKLEHLFPICVPSCHDRKPSILEKLDDFKNAKVFVFIYENEVDLYKYLDKYENVTVVVVPIEYLSIMKMRVFIQQFMGDKTYWVTDDDLKKFYISNDKLELTQAEGFRVFDTIIKEYGLQFDICGINSADAAIKFYKKETPVSFGGAFQVILYNGKRLNELDLKYTGDDTVNEDVEFNINAKLKNAITLKFNFARFVAPYGGKDSIASPIDVVKKRVFKNYLKFGENIVHGYTKAYGVNEKPARKVQEEIVYDEEKLKFCREGDYDGFIQYLQDKKRKNKNLKPDNSLVQSKTLF